VNDILEVPIGSHNVFGPADGVFAVSLHIRSVVISIELGSNVGMGLDEMDNVLSSGSVLARQCADVVMEDCPAIALYMC